MGLFMAVIRKLYAMLLLVLQFYFEYKNFLEKIISLRLCLI